MFIGQPTQGNMDHGYRQTIPDLRHGENHGLRILGNKRGELKQVRSNQTQTETNEQMIMQNDDRNQKHQIWT